MRRPRVHVPAIAEDLSELSTKAEEWIVTKFDRIIMVEIFGFELYFEQLDFRRILLLKKNCSSPFALLFDQLVDKIIIYQKQSH